MNDWKRADEIYASIRHKLKGLEGKIIAIDTKSSDYAIADDILEACDALKKKHPNAIPHLMRIGFKAVYFIGALPREDALSIRTALRNSAGKGHVC